MLKKSQWFNDPYTIILVSIIVVNALLKWSFFCGLNQADDFSYGMYAYSLFRVPMSWDMQMDFRILRMTLLLPVSFLFRVFSPTEFVAVVYPMILSFGTIVLVYLIGRRIYGVHVGLLGALVLATFPADIVFGTMLLPDIVAPFYMVLAVWCFLKAESEKKRTAHIFYLLAGLSVFLAFNTRENSYYFLLFFLPFAFNRARWKRGLYMIGVGFAVPVLFLYSIYFFKSGDFLFNLHLAQHYRDPLIKSGYIRENSFSWYIILYYMLPGFFRRQGLMGSTYGYTFYIGIPCLIYIAVKAVKKRNTLQLIAPWFFLCGYLFLEYGTVSFSHYQMMRKMSRFLLVLTPAMAMGYGVVIADVFGIGTAKIIKLKNVKIRWISGLIAFVVLAGVLYTSYNVASQQKTSREENMRIFKWGYFEVLKKRPLKPFYGTGGWWFNKLAFYCMPDLRFSDMPGRRSTMFRDLKAVKEPSELAGSYVILDRRHFSGNNDLRIKHSYDEFGNYVKVPPKEWNLLGSNYSVEIYEVPDGWTYLEPDGKKIALDALMYAFEVEDVELFINSLHPDFLSKLKREQIMELMEILSDKNNPGRAELLGGLLEYREYYGRWKLKFKID